MGSEGPTRRAEPEWGEGPSSRRWPGAPVCTQPPTTHRRELTHARTALHPLPGEKLDYKACEALEEVFKRLQFKVVDLEQTNLDEDVSISATTLPCLLSSGLCRRGHPLDKGWAGPPEGQNREIQCDQSGWEECWGSGQGPEKGSHRPPERLGLCKEGRDLGSQAGGRLCHPEPFQERPAAPTPS